MIANILAWIMIATGAIFLVKPELLQKRLAKKSIKYVKKILFGIAMFFAVLLISAGFKIEGILSKLLMILGIIAVLKGAFLLKAKAAEKIIAWMVQQKPVFFRVWAGAQIVLGVTILLLK